MKKIEAIFKPFKLDEIKEALANERIQRFSLFEVNGAGCQQITIKQYRGVVYSEDYSEVGVAILADDEEADRIAEIFVTTLRSKCLCHGEVMILPLDNRQNPRPRWIKAPI
jgi:nitrogen regulatory protein PII